MADQYAWDKAKQAGYKTDVVPITRQTIADGNLLNSSVVEVFSSRDKYINDNLSEETASANSVYTTVNTNSAKTWPNSALVGFSAVKADSVVCTAAANDTLTINVQGLTTALSNNTLTISLPDYYKDSYFQRTNRTNTQKMIDLPEPWGSNKYTSTECGVLFGGGGTKYISTSGNSLNTRILAINIDRCTKNTSIDYGIDGGIQLNPMDVSTKWGININSRYDSVKNGYIQINDASGFGVNGLAINKSCATTGTSAFDEFWSFAMNGTTCTNAYNCIGFTNASFGTVVNSVSNSVAMFNSTGYQNSIALFSAKCNNSCTFAMYNSTAQPWSVVMYNSNSMTTRTYGSMNILMHNCVCDGGSRNLALYNCKLGETNGNIALYNSITSGIGKSSSAQKNIIALYNSTANYSVTFVAYNASSNKNGGYCVGLYGSTVAGGDSFAAYRSSAIVGGNNIAMYDSVAENGCSIAMYNGSAVSNSYALYNSTARNGNIAVFNSTALSDFNLNTCMYNSRTYAKNSTTWQESTMSVYSIFMYNSMPVVTDLSAFSAIDSGGTTKRVKYDSITTNSIAKYNSNVTDTYNIAEYNSLIGCGVQRSIAMFGSNISASHVEKSYAGTYSGCTTGVMAFFDSTAADTNDKILLWNNKVCIEPKGYINKIRIIDTINYRVNTEYYQSYSIEFPTAEFIYLHPDYNSFIIG